MPTAAATWTPLSWVAGTLVPPPGILLFCWLAPLGTPGWVRPPAFWMAVVELDWVLGLLARP